MNYSTLIRQAILSEKAYKQMEKGIYSFLVDMRAKKEDISKAIEKRFSVKVKKVNIAGKSAKAKRITGTRKQVLTGSGKKAIVYLIPGQNISMLLPKTETKKTKKVQKEEKKEGLISKIRRSKPEKQKEKK